MTALRPGRHVVVVLQGGIGNQLFQLCAGAAIQKRTGYPVFYDCDLGFRNDPSGRQFELAHLIPSEQRADPIPPGRMWRNPLLERLAVTVEHGLMFRRGKSSLPLPLTEGLVRWWPTSEVVCRSCFQLLDYVDSETVERIRDAMNVRTGAASTEVAVHFRLSRELNRHGETMREHAGTVLGMDFYRKALRRVRAEIEGAYFRVFSDSGLIPENVFQPEDIVLLDHPLQGEPPSHTLGRMARCGHLVIANSTFSWWAAYLASGEGKRVYAPQDWRFNNRAPAQQGIFPGSWHRI